MLDGLSVVSLTADQVVAVAGAAAACVQAETGTTTAMRRELAAVHASRWWRYINFR